MGFGACRMMVQQNRDKLVVRVEGRASMLQAPTVRRLAECFIGNEGGKVRLDLRDCTFLDSTFLGTILFLQRKHGELGTGRFALLPPSLECNKLMREMGVADVVSVDRDESLPDATWMPLDNDARDPAQVRASVMQAHQELAQLSGAAGEQFRAVQSCLEGDRQPGCEAKGNEREPTRRN